MVEPEGGAGCLATNCGAAAGGSACRLCVRPSLRFGPAAGTIGGTGTSGSGCWTCTALLLPVPTASDDSSIVVGGHISLGDMVEPEGGAGCLATNCDAAAGGSACRLCFRPSLRFGPAAGTIGGTGTSGSGCWTCTALLLPVPTASDDSSIVASVPDWEAHGNW